MQINHNHEKMEKINNLSSGKSSIGSSSTSSKHIHHNQSKHNNDNKRNNMNKHSRHCHNEEQGQSEELIEVLHKKLKLKEKMLVKLDHKLNGKIDSLTYELEELKKGKKAMEVSRRLVDKQSKTIHELGNSVSYH